MEFLKIVSEFEKEIGPISAHLIQDDSEYRDRIIEEARLELLKKMAKSMALEPYFINKKVDGKPMDNMPAFHPPTIKTILKFRIKEPKHEID